MLCFDLVIENQPFSIGRYLHLSICKSFIAETSWKSTLSSSSRSLQLFSESRFLTPTIDNIFGDGLFASTKNFRPLLLRTISANRSLFLFVKLFISSTLPNRKAQLLLFSLYVTFWPFTSSLRGWKTGCSRSNYEFFPDTKR